MREQITQQKVKEILSHRNTNEKQKQRLVKDMAAKRVIVSDRQKH